MNPGPSAETVPDETVAIIREGTQYTFDQCAIGVVATTNDGDRPTAFLSVFNKRSGVDVNTHVQAGSLLPACGSLLRIGEIVPQPAPENATPGSAGGQVALELNPVPIVDVAFELDSVVLAPGDTTKMGESMVLVHSIENGVAHIGHWTHKRVPTPLDRDQLTNIDLRVGDVVSFSSDARGVLNIVNPEPQIGVPGWLEIK